MGISGSVLKLVAVVTMLIDHVAAGILLPYLNTYTNSDIYFLGTICNRDDIVMLYVIMRRIGRIAFPIYCFLLVEGFSYTKNKWKYLKNLGIFAVISEIPFDTGVNTDVKYAGMNALYTIRHDAEFMDHQNVFFTLFFGLLMLILIEKFSADRTKKYLSFFFVFVIAAATIFLNTDYSVFGIILILIFYLCRKNRMMAVICGYLFFALVLIDGEEAYSLPGFVLIMFYNNKRGFIGNNEFMKMFFYAFYPVHLIVIYLIRVAVFN